MRRRIEVGSPTTRLTIDFRGAAARWPIGPVLGEAMRLARAAMRDELTGFLCVLWGQV
jgi:hypothetical protein